MYIYEGIDVWDPFRIASRMSPFIMLIVTGKHIFNHPILFHRILRVNLPVFWPGASLQNFSRAAEKENQISLFQPIDFNACRLFN